MNTLSNQEGQNLLLSPSYIVGFVDGEGCFSIKEIIKLRESMNPKGKGFRKRGTRLVREIRTLSGNSK